MNHYNFQQRGNNFQQGGNNREQFTTFLSNEAIKELMSKNSKIDITEIPEIEQQEALCLHRTHTGLTIRELGDGYYKCDICGTKFRYLNLEDQEMVNDIVNNYLNLVETIKISYYDINSGLKTFFETTPLVKRMKNIAKSAQNSIVNYSNKNEDNYNMGGNTRMSSIYNDLTNGYYNGRPNYNNDHYINQRDYNLYNNNMNNNQYYNQQDQYMNNNNGFQMHPHYHGESNNGFKNGDLLFVDGKYYRKEGNNLILVENNNIAHNINGNPIVTNKITGEIEDKNNKQ